MCEVKISKDGSVHIKIFITKRDGSIDVGKTIAHYFFILTAISTILAGTNAGLHKYLFKPTMRHYVASISYTKVQSDSLISASIKQAVEPVCKTQRIMVQMLKNDFGNDAYKTAKKQVEFAGEFEE